jgi:carbamoyltransferase
MIAAAEEERFRRIKHWAGFPSHAITFCLKEARVSLEQVDHICIGRDPKAKIWSKAKYVLKSLTKKNTLVFDRLKNSTKVAKLKDEFAEYFGVNPVQIKKKLVHVEHHRAHLASAFYPSPYGEAAILSIDGAGDFTTTMLARGKGNHIEVLEDVDFPHSVGVFYSAMTQLLGFPYYGDEYKVMGLAPYGEPKYVDQLRDVVQLIPGGLFELNLSYFQSPHKGYVHYSDDFLPLVKPLFNEKMQKELKCFGLGSILPGSALPLIRKRINENFLT